MDVKSYLEKNVLLFDGAMGTYYGEKYPEDGVKCELANLTHPDRIKMIHREYLEAGARAIKTNTFAANTLFLECSQQTLGEIIGAGWHIACSAALESDAAVFADIGPLPADNEDGKFIIDQFLDLGATNFIFETLPDAEFVQEMAAYIKSRCKSAFIMASFAVTPDGFTRHGAASRVILEQMKTNAAIDAAGFNCVSGPHHLLALTRENIKGFVDGKTIFSVMPNAGYPTIVGGRTVFDGSPDYFAARCMDLTQQGVKILGGCCGTTPEHIRKTAAAIKGEHPGKASIAHVVQTNADTLAHVSENTLAEKLDAGKRIVAVELDPPADSNIAKFMEGARRLKAAGVDAITVADCPVARVRVDSSMLAAKLRRELQIDPIPHMTCRDRNINATKALLLGLSVEQVHNVLVVTGDPVPSAERDEVKGVFSFNSVVLADYIRQLSAEGFAAPFRVYGALNVNARNFDAELKRALRKQAAGVSAFLTQPVFSEAAFENLARAYETLDATILGGIIPIVSHRNALFMSQEMAGIHIPDDVIARYDGLTREDAQELAVEMSIDFARRMKPITGGWYFITPFQRVQLIEQILQGLSET